ncbi:MAG: RNA-binding protein [Flavobacterium sp. BFFFF2]|nr:MAG: RNA-binding protein [Flavobacterium sp. BFFFF2]
MAKRIKNDSSMKEVLAAIIDQNHWKPQLQKISIEEAWHEVLGKGVSNYTSRVLLKDRTLLVQLTSSVLRDELMYGKSKIIQMLNEHMGEEVVHELILK